MPEKMTNDEYLKIQTQLFLIANLVDKLDLDGFLLAIEKAESVGPILDPTLYRAAQDNLQDIKFLAENLLRFQQESRRIAAKKLPGR